MNMRVPISMANISNTCTHIHCTVYRPTQMHAYRDDQKDEVTLRLLILPHRGKLHGLIQDGGEVGGAIELHSAHRVLVGIQNAL